MHQVILRTAGSYMGMEQQISIDNVLEVAARAAVAKDTFIKPFRPSIPPTLEALHQVNATVERKIDWVIEGWLPSDLVPHFGRSKVGKSTGIAGQIAAIASVDTATGRRAHDWKGHKVLRHGIALWYSGEETTGEVSSRMKREFSRMGYRGDDLDAVATRVVPLCPKSWSADQFAGLNPFICARMPVAGVGIRHDQYQATATLEWIYDLVDSHNAAVDARGGASDEKIIGIVFDSMTSTAGFSSTDEEGIQNLLFDLGRSAQRRNLFKILVAHSPQSAKPEPADPDHNSIDRLKGNGAWSAICRLMVEWRLPAERSAKETWYEAKLLIDQGVVSVDDELVIAVVADGNIAYSKQKMWFKRDGSGGHIDLSRFMVSEPRGFNAAKWKARQDRHAAEAAASSAAAKVKVDREPARDAVLDMVKEAMVANEQLAREKGEKLAKAVTGGQVIGIFKSWKAKKAARERYPVLDREPKFGGISERTGGDFTIRYWMERLAADGSLAGVVGGYVPADRVANGYRLKEVAANDQDSSAPALIDLAPVRDAVLAVVGQLDAEFESCGGDETHQIAVNRKNIQLALQSTDFQKAHPVLRDAYLDGRLVLNGPSTKAPVMQSAEWYCEELSADGKLFRQRDGNYSRNEMENAA